MGYFLRMFLGKRIKLGRVFGVEIAIDYSWFWIFLLVVWSFSAGIFPVIDPGKRIGTYILAGSISALVFFLSVLIHEMSHTLIARKNNLPVDRITLFLLGGVSEMPREPDSAKAEFKIAIAGPIASIILGLFFTGAGFLIGRFIRVSLFTNALEILGYVNIFLAVFNLLPGFPLDGGRILRALFWWGTKDLITATRWASYSGYIVAALMVMFGLWEILFVGIFGGIWIILIAFFLFQSARSAFKQTVITVALEKVSAYEIANKNILSVNEDASLTKAIQLMLDDQVLVVKKDNLITGLITLGDINKIPEDHWTSRVAKAMHPINRFKTVKKNESSIDALLLLERNEIPVVPVKENNEIVGLITPKELNDYLNLIKSEENQNG